MGDGDGRVVVAYLHRENIGAVFHAAFFDLFVYDTFHEQRILRGGGIIRHGAGTNAVPFARTKVTAQFHTDHTAEWLLWVDDDMGFAPDALEQLLEVADPVERPVVGALCFAQTEEGLDSEGTPIVSTFPTIYRWHPESKLFARFTDYPRGGEVLKCNGTGAAFLLIHRDVIDRVATEFGPKWFHQIPHPDGSGDMYGEDLSFCLRLGLCGIPVHVHTGVRTSHQKTRYLTERLFDDEMAAIPNFVVIPAKDELAMTRDLILELERQGECDRIFVMDHGSGVEFRHWMDTHAGIVTRIDCGDCDGISQMWNRGLDAAHELSGRSNVALLNNDITIGDRVLSKLGRALRSSSDIAVVGPVGPDYDGPREGLRDVEQIAAGRQDGSGLPGWAFMVRGEMHYRFPEQIKWWYGDNDLVAYALKEHVRVCLALDAECVHIDGGSATGKWDDPEWVELLEADRAAFEERWGLTRS